MIDTDQEVHYHVVDSTHAFSRSRTTRVQEVENAGKSDEKLEAEGHDRGFMWRMNTYWRFEEKDGGTYVECQAISLTRDIPTGLGWMVGSFVTSVPRESLTFTHHRARSLGAKNCRAARTINPRFSGKSALNHGTRRSWCRGKYPPDHSYLARPDCSHSKGN